MSTTIGDYPYLLEIDAGTPVRETTFTANGELLVGTGDKGVQVWRVEDGKRVATLPVESGANRVAISRDGRYIAAGPSNGKFIVVWNATTYEQVFRGETESGVYDVDFSPDSTRFVLAHWYTDTVAIWDVEARKKVQTLNHGVVIAVKYSPQGDRIVTASERSIRIWDSHDGRLLVEFKDQVASRNSLLWRNNDLFVATNDKKIERIDASTGLAVAEWPVPDVDSNSCIALSHLGKFIAFSAKQTITFLDPSGNARPIPIQHTDDISSISFDRQFLAIAARKKITVKGLPFTISVPELGIDGAVLDAWKHDRLTDAEALLSAAISTSQNSTDHELAIRALIQARLGHWDDALVDANQSIDTRQSLLGYVAKSVALVGKGEKDEGILARDIAFEHFRSEYGTFLLLVKAVVLFMAGHYVDAISRMNDLITDSAHAPVDSALYAVQVYMYLLLGNNYMATGDYEHAVQSFEDARIKLADRTRQPQLIVSLISGWKFDDLVITIKQRLCEALLAGDRAKEAGECILRMLDEETDMAESVATWVSDFKCRCRSKLEDHGDNAMVAKQYEDAISRYTAALSLNLTTPQDLLVKRSKAYAEQEKWNNAFNDANEVIKLDPSSPSGYERKHAAFLGAGRHDNAIDAFETMLSKMSQSPNPEIRERSHHYVRPEQTKEAIRASIQNAIRDSPLVLINALSGHLCNKSQQAAAFESTPAFTRLVASMTTNIDHALIEQVVGDFYRYTTLSHTWEGDEPLYETVFKTVVYDLKGLPTCHKLQMFCKIVRDEGFNWAWSDTCCIDKGDNFILQESLVSMFKWYEGSALTIIFLCDVDRLAEIGALMMSLWNSRGWTLQEYHASKVVRVYTKDWTPYLGLTIYNYKESPEIISEMEKATGISAESLKALRPGLNEIREKLRLASTRRTTRVEDAAYSLLGIFSMTLPATYGEGDKALGRLLSQLLSNSGDTSILAWTGTSGSFNSCLPTNIVVFSEPLTLHIPPTIPDAEMETITSGLRASSLDLDLITMLYERVDELPTPTFAVQRMRLPCLAFKIKTITLLRKESSEAVFRAQAGGLEIVEIKTRQNIARAESLYLIHPWIDFLLDRRVTGNIVDLEPHGDDALEFDEPLTSDSFPELPDTLDADPLDDASAPSPTAPVKDAQIEFLARLKQPFGALLFAPTRRNVPEYKRISTENVITAQVQEFTPATLNRLIEGARVLDVL